MSRLSMPAFRPITTRADLPAAATEFLPAGANLVMTPELVELLAAAPVALRNRRLVVVDGQPGCGKSTAKAVLSAACPIRTAVFSVPATRLNPGKRFMENAHAAVLGTPVADLSQRLHENSLAHLLTKEPLLLLIDEAQNASAEVLRNVRTMLEMPNTRFAVALFGTGVRDNLKRDPMLWTWRGHTRTFEPLLTPHQVAHAPKAKAADVARKAHLLPTLAALHPRLAATAPELLIETNRLHGHGLLRNWATLLEWLLDLDPDGGGFTRRQLIDAITALDGVTPAFAA